LVLYLLHIKQLIYSHYLAERVGRSAFIGIILNGKRTAETEPHRVIISRANIDEVNEQILPFDDVLVTDNIKGKRSETIMRFGAVTEEMLSNPVLWF
jgi:hypothetical protein